MTGSVSAGLSAKERAYRDTKARILDGSLPGGDLITEGQVAETLAMSRTPVREAFLRLEAEGLLRLFPKRGALVVAVSPSEVEAVLEARELVEGHALAKLCAASADERAAVSRALVDVLDEQRGALAASDEQSFAEGDRRFHTVLVESARNPILLELYASLRDRQLRMNLGSLERGPDRPQAILAQHQAIVDALDTGDADDARVRLRIHLDATRASVVGR
ncbi:GntR family transcriptional regulator [Actinomycetospora sp. C-140]